MIQGGDKEGTGQGSATIKDLKDDGEDTAYSIKGEFIANGVDNNLKFEEGDIVHKIEEVEVKVADDSEESGNTEVSTPVNPPKITSLKVETYGVDYELPDTLTPFDYMSWMYKQYGLDPSSLSYQARE